jgi:hypothetical protein
MVNEAFPEGNMFLNSSFTKVKPSIVNADIHLMMKVWKAASISHMRPDIGNWWESNSGKLLIVLLPSFITTRSSGNNSLNSFSYKLIVDTTWKRKKKPRPAGLQLLSVYCCRSNVITEPLPTNDRLFFQSSS